MRSICMIIGAFLAMYESLFASAPSASVIMAAAVIMGFPIILATTRTEKPKPTVQESSLKQIYREHKIHDHMVETDWEAFERDVDRHQRYHQNDEGKLIATAKVNSGYRSAEDQQRLMEKVRESLPPMIAVHRDPNRPHLYRTPPEDCTMHLYPMLPNHVRSVVYNGDPHGACAFCGTILTINSEEEFNVDQERGSARRLFAAPFTTEEIDR